MIESLTIKNIATYDPIDGVQIPDLKKVNFFFGYNGSGKSTCAFISTINDESHKITALDSVYYQKIINEQPQILFDVFIEIFKSIGKEHYELMMDEQIQP